VTSGKGGGVGVSEVGQYVKGPDRNGAVGAQDTDGLIAKAAEVEHTTVGSVQAESSSLEIDE